VAPDAKAVSALYAGLKASETWKLIASSRHRHLPEIRSGFSRRWMLKRFGTDLCAHLIPMIPRAFMRPLYSQLLKALTSKALWTNGLCRWPFVDVCRGWLASRNQKCFRRCQMFVELPLHQPENCWYCCGVILLFDKLVKGASGCRRYKYEDYVPILSGAFRHQSNIATTPWLKSLWIIMLSTPGVALGGFILWIVTLIVADHQPASVVLVVFLTIVKKNTTDWTK